MRNLNTKHSYVFRERRCVSIIGEGGGMSCVSFHNIPQVIRELSTILEQLVADAPVAFDEKRAEQLYYEYKREEPDNDV